MPHLLVPALEVLVGHFAACVENQHGSMSAEIIAGVELIEGLLTGCVPDVLNTNN